VLAIVPAGATTGPVTVTTPQGSATSSTPFTVWGNGTPASASVTYLHTDHLGTPRAGTDQSGTVTWRWEGTAFGETLPQEDPDGDGKKTVINQRYAGQYFDQETGLHYNWFRYYDPKIGRYISSDPIGLAGGLNTYTYVRNNPLRWTDPLGLDVTVCLYPGHIGLGVNTTSTVGRRPADSSSLIDAILGKNVPGEVSPDTGSKLDCSTIKSSADQDKKVQQYIDENINNPGVYNLTQKSCVDLVRDPLRDIIDIPLSDTNLPASLYGEIFRQNRRQQR
jgi:RHS repeat-associated protein